MNRKFIALSAAAALATTFAIAPASAQNAPPPGNVNPGSLNSGAEQTGAPNQPRSTAGGAYYGQAYGPGLGAFAAAPGAYDSYAYAPMGGPSVGVDVGPIGFSAGVGYGPGYDAYAYDRGYYRYDRPRGGISIGFGPRYW